VPEPGPGEAIVRVTHLSIDPTIRTWMDDAPGYLPPIEIGAVVRSGGLGTVVASRSEQFPVGGTVFGMLGWQDVAVVDETPGAGQVVPDGMDPTAVLSVFGVTGHDRILRPARHRPTEGGRHGGGVGRGWCHRLGGGPDRQAQGCGQGGGHRRRAREVRVDRGRARLRRGDRLQVRRCGGAPARGVPRRHRRLLRQRGRRDPRHGAGAAIDRCPGGAVRCDLGLQRPLRWPPAGTRSC
jgi:hypothetical protein